MTGDEQVINRILNLDNEINFYKVVNSSNRFQERNERIETLI